MKEPQSFVTNAIHAGEPETSSATPIYLSATADARYARGGNPTLDAFEEKVRTLDGGAMAISTACGMAAISQTLFTLLKPGDRLVAHQTVYHWTTHLIKEILPGFGIEVDLIDMTDLEQLEGALKKPATVVYFEPLANPRLDVIDSLAAIRMGHDAGARVVMDNTFLTPYLFKPLEQGADVVLHSATKYLSGHGDALGGIVVTADEAVGRNIVTVRNSLGGILSPVNGFFLLRGIKTLTMRMDRHCANAQGVAEYLEAHPRVLRVIYPGLPNSQGHAIAAAQWGGFGGMVSFQVEGQELRDQFLERVKLCKPWVSLGDAGSLVSERGDDEVRMSVGLEDVEDILGDLEQALG